MVNGTLSRILYIGAFVCMGLCIIGYIVLAVAVKPVPAELGIAFTGSLALVAGSHITPPNVKKTTDGAVVEPAATYTRKERL